MYSDDYQYYEDPEQRKEAVSLQWVNKRINPNTYYDGITDMVTGQFVLKSDKLFKLNIPLVVNTPPEFDSYDQSTNLSCDMLDTYDAYNTQLRPDPHCHYNDHLDHNHDMERNYSPDSFRGYGPKQ